MPLPVITDVFRVALNWVDANGQHAVNVTHFRDDGMSGDPDDLHAALTSNVVANMWVPVSNAAHVEEVAITPLDGSTATDSQLTGGGSIWQGQNAGQPVPQVAGLVKLQTDVRGPRARGRLFLPFISEACINAGRIGDATNLANWSAAWEGFILDMGTSNWPMVVASYAHSDANPVRNVIVEEETGTQRRRQERNR